MVVEEASAVEAAVGIRRRSLVLGVLVYLVCLSSPAAAEETYPYVAQWPPSNASYSFLGPGAIALDKSGNIYVADAGNHRIVKLSPSGTLLTTWGSPGTGGGQFDLPGGVAVDTSGNVYVSDSGNHRVQKFSSTGTYRAEWGSSLNFPLGIGVGPSGNLYVADTGNHRIVKFSPSGAQVAAWGSFGAGGGQFDNPEGVTVGPSGDVYVADTANGRIQRFTSAGVHLGTLRSELDAPSGLGVDSGGTLYVADAGNHRVLKLSPTGTDLAAIGSPGVGDGQLTFPLGVAADGSGNVYVADTDNHRVQKFRDTSPPTTTLSRSSQPDITGGLFRPAFSKPPTVALTSSEPGRTYYNWSSSSHGPQGQWVPYTGPITAPTYSAHFYYYSTDLAGNKERFKPWLYRFERPLADYGARYGTTFTSVWIHPNPLFPNENAWITLFSGKKLSMRTTSFCFTINKPGNVWINVYNYKGRVLRMPARPIVEDGKLFKRWLLPGRYYQGWNGKDQNGRQLPPGTYKYVLELRSWDQMRNQWATDSHTGTVTIGDRAAAASLANRLSYVSLISPFEAVWMYPNPFYPGQNRWFAGDPVNDPTRRVSLNTTSFCFTLTAPGYAWINVYDHRGLVRRMPVRPVVRGGKLYNRWLPAGRYYVGWNGKDDARRLLLPGNYRYALELNDRSSTRTTEGIVSIRR